MKPDDVVARLEIGAVGDAMWPDGSDDTFSKRKAKRHVVCAGPRQRHGKHSVLWNHLHLNFGQPRCRSSTPKKEKPKTRRVSDTRQRGKEHG
jgi:hypothetical protein